MVSDAPIDDQDVGGVVVDRGDDPSVLDQRCSHSAPPLSILACGDERIARSLPPPLPHLARGQPSSGTRASDLCSSLLFKEGLGAIADGASAQGAIAATVSAICFLRLAADSNTISSSRAFGPFEIAREDAAGVGQVAPTAAAAVDRLDPADRAARSDQNRNAFLRREPHQRASSRVGPLPRPKPSITSPATPRSIIASSPRRSQPSASRNSSTRIFQPIDLERAAQHRAPMNDDLARRPPPRAHHARTTGTSRRRSHASWSRRAPHGSSPLKQTSAPRPRASGDAATRIAFRRFGGPSDCGSSARAARR